MKEKATIDREMGATTDKISLSKHESSSKDIEDPSDVDTEQDNQKNHVLDSQNSTLFTTSVLFTIGGELKESDIDPDRISGKVDSTETSAKRTKKQSVRFPSTLSENFQERILTDREITLRSRVVFKWLPIRCQNDLVHGSWWFVAASILATIIPVFPLINVYLLKDQFWPINFANYLATSTQAIVYAILIGCGIMFTLGSLLLLRVFSVPKSAPIIYPSSFLHNLFPSDEVTASWLFFLGTAPTVAVTVLYSYYLPEYTLVVYQVAIIFCVLATFAVLAFTCAIYPHQQSSSSSSSSSPSSDRQYLAPIARCLVCHHRHLIRHVENDWLVLCWLFLIGSMLCTLGCIATLVYECSTHNRRGIYDLTTASVDTLLVVIGSVYFVAGSYD